jgi:hypothetical protein
MIANCVLFVFVINGEFVAQTWMIIYSGEGAREETDHNLALWCVLARARQGF